MPKPNTTRSAFFNNKKKATSGETRARKQRFFADLDQCKSGSLLGPVTDYLREEEETLKEATRYTPAAASGAGNN